MQILVIAEHDNKALNPATRTAVAAGREISAACGGGDLQVIVAGADCLAVAQAAAGLEGVSGVIHLDGPALAQGLAEDLVDALLAQVRARDVRAVVFPATTNGKNWAPRLAALLDVAAISDVIRVVDAKTFERPIYAGNVIATVESSDPILVITARTTAFTPVADSGTSVSISTESAVAPTGRADFVGQALSKSDRPELASAKVVVSGGRALGSAENIASCWSRWPIASVPLWGHRARPSMQAMRRTTFRWAKPVRWWLRSYILPSACPVPFNISRE